MGEGRLENLQKEVSSAIRRQRSWTDAAALLRTCATRRVLLNEFCLSALLGSYAKATKWRKSLDGLEASNDDLLVPDVFCYTAVLNALERGRCWSLLGSLFIRMSQEGIQRNLISVTSARAARPLWRHTSETLRLLRRWQLRADVVCWSSVLKAAHGGTPSTWTRLCALLTDMSSGSIAGDVISFNAAMHRTPWQLSGAVLRMMNLQRVFPDVATFTHAMNACALKLSWHEALLFAGAAWTAQVQLDQMALTPLLAAHPWRKGLSLAQARAQVGTHTWNDGGLQLDSVCWSALLAASHWQKALELGRCLPCASITLTTAGHNALLSASGHWARAWTLFERGDALRAEVDVFSYNSVVASQKRWQSALVILQEMSTSQVEGDRIGVNALISLSSDSSEWPRAFDAFRGLSSSSLQPDVVTFSARMEACAQALQWELGFDSLVAMMNVGVEANAMTRTSLCSALCSLRGAWTMALATWKRTADVDASYYNILMSSCGSHWRMVLHLLHQMPLVPPILAPDQKCWSTAARALSAGVVWRGALEILEMLGEHDGLDMVMQDVLLSTLDLSGHLRSYGEALQAMADGWREGNAHAVKGTPPGDRVWEEPSRGSPDSSCWSSGVMFPKCTEFSSARHGPTSWRGALAEMRSRQLEANLIRHTGTLKSFSRSLLWEMTIASLQEVARLDLEIDLICCGTAMGSCRKRWQQSLRFIKYAEYQDLPPSSIVLGQAVSACKEVALWQLAGDLVRPLAEPDLLAATAVLGACVERWTQSLACLSRMSTLRLLLDQVPYNSAMKACAQNGFWPTALDLTRKLGEMSIALDGTTLSTCRTACSRAEVWELPLQLLQTSLLLRITPDLIDYGATLSACEKTGQWRPGLCLLNTLRESELQPDLACFHAFMDGAGKDGWILPIHMLTALLHTNISSIMTTYNIAINACDDWRRISEWLASARRAQLGLRVDAISWNSALKAGASPWQRPLEILRQMQDEALLPDALTADAWANTWRPQQWQQALSAQFCRSPLPRLAAAAVQGSPWQLASSLATTSRQRRAEPVSVGDGGGAWPRALQLVGGGAWQQSLQLLYGAPMQRLRAEAELLRGVSGSAAWPLQVKLLSSMEPKRQAFRCELYRSVGRWWAALHVWEEMEQHGLRADEVHCSSLLRACDEERVPNGWCRALALLRSLSSGVRRDPILWNALLATTSLPRGGSAAPADPRRSAWARPLVLVKAMWESAVVPDIVTFNTLLSASRWEGMLAILLQMEQMRTPIEDVAALTVVDSCAQAGQLALGRHILENIFQHVPAVLRLWSFAQLGVANASAIAAAFRHARDDERRTGLSAAEVPKVWWACGILGVNSSFSQRLAQISAGLLSRFDSAELLAITMAAATESTRAPVVTGELLAQLQWELLRRLSRDPAGSGLSALQAALQDFLGILWALHFASATSRSASARVDVLRWADLLEAEAAKVMRPTAQPLSSTAPSTSAMDVEVPQVLLELPDRMALTKPAGWEVYGDTPHQLLSYLRARDARVIDDAQHAFGFLHRLDVPSSGLILSAKTYRAYYDLQFQLVTGQILRDYLALAHGRWAPSLQQVSARLNCFEDTTRAGGQGRPSRTRTKLQSYHHFLSSSFSLLLARIDTGRRHQIRSHFAFLGHPTVSDSRYSSVATFGSDLQLCPRNFIHRYHLAFKDSLQASHQVIMPTPKDLNDCLLLFPETETLRIWLAGEVQHFDRVDAVQKCRSEFWALGIVKAVQLY
ncbi:unnamed protein product [Durusdinium trenchii]|uniref:Pseudouridine synthase RsuA/RluA-like domain-containing protein n=1 Tax=Durusdinium trenchii TaxID=1381693 RepID=A0ABP0N3G4_9DINO